MPRSGDNAKGIKLNGIKVNLNQRGLKDLIKEIEQLSEDEKEIEKPNEIVNLVEKILEFNNQN